MQVLRLRYLVFGLLSITACKTTSKNNDNKTTVVPGTVATTTTPTGTSTDAINTNGSATGTGTTVTNPDGSVTQSDPTQSPTQNTLFAECAGASDRKIVAGVYIVPSTTKQLPDFNKLSKIKDVCIKQLDVTGRDFKAGFPGIDNLIEFFALNINYSVNVPTTGEYQFFLSSDDGSILSIDDQTVVFNDFIHDQKEQSAKKHLTAGWHKFNVKYFQGPRYKIALELRWQKPGEKNRQYIDESLFARPVQ